MDTLLPRRLAQKFTNALARALPEQHLFLRSGSQTRFIRLGSATQAVAVTGTALVFGWTIVASAVLFMDSIGSGNARDQAKRELTLYEARLDTLSQERDLRAGEAAKAQDRFNLALGQVSGMQSALLSSEDRRKELETGIDVIQRTLRRTMIERDKARAEAQAVRLSLVEETGSARTEAAQAADAENALAFLTTALADTAAVRDDLAAAASDAQAQIETAEQDRRLTEERNAEIFRQLEDAVSVSMEPLDEMFRAVGLSPEDVLDTVRRGYSGQGGPLMPVSFSTKGGQPSAEELRANAILEQLDMMNSYRIAVERTPFALPLTTSYRMTSGFGHRSDPFGRGSRMHAGIDMAGKHATPVFATADGTVVQADWSGAYGQLVTVKHAFGLQTLYGHLSRIRVSVGQRVSRGEQIGDMGSTGRSTGTHLHYEVRVGDTPVNPMTYIKAARDVL